MVQGNYNAFNTMGSLAKMLSIYYASPGVHRLMDKIICSYIQYFVQAFQTSIDEREWV